MRPKLVVLCYHGISSSWPDATAVCPETFARQVASFVRAGYRGATLTDAVGERGGAPTLAVTFDDAASSVYRLAAPVLAELGVPGTVFVPTDYPDTGRPMAWAGIDRWLGGEHQPELEAMGWGELGELQERGWEIGSHTCSHPHLEELDDERLDFELVRSKEVCEKRLSRPCPTLAYPYGTVDERVAAAAGRAGYSVAVSVPVSRVPVRDLMWPRIGVYRGDGAARLWMRTLRRSFAV